MFSLEVSVRHFGGKYKQIGIKIKNYKEKAKCLVDFSISVCNERGENQGTPYTQGRVFHSACGKCAASPFRPLPASFTRFPPSPMWFLKRIFQSAYMRFSLRGNTRGGSYRPLRPAPRLCPVRTRSERPSRPGSSALYNVFLFPEKSFNLSALPHKWLKTSVYVAEGFDFSTFQLVSSFQPFLSTFHPGCSILQIGCSILQFAVQSFKWLFNPSNLPSGAMSRSPSRLKALRPQMKLSEGLKNQTFQPHLP